MAPFRPVVRSRRNAPAHSAPADVALTAVHALCILAAVSLCCLLPVAASAIR